MVWEEMGAGVMQSLSIAPDRTISIDIDAEHLGEQPEQLQDHRGDHRLGGRSQPRAGPFMGSLHTLHARPSNVHFAEVATELRLLRKEREEVSTVIAELREEVRALREFRQSVTRV